MKEKNFLLVMLMIIVIIGGIVNTVKANTSSTFKANVTSSTTTLKAGEEVTITIGVSDINMGENGINTLEGKIKYDINIFDTVSSSAIQSLNNWTTTYNDESSSLNGKFLAVNLSSGTKESMQIFSVKFKVKSTVTGAKDTTIEFKDITSNDGTDLINAGSKSITLKINGENPSGTNIDNSNTSSNSGNTQNTTASGSTTGSNKNANTADKTTAKTALPKAGISVAIIGIIAIAVIIVIALGIKNRTMRDIK